MVSPATVAGPGDPDSDQFQFQRAKVKGVPLSWRKPLSTLTSGPVSTSIIIDVGMRAIISLHWR